MSRWLALSLSGNWISKVINKSPRRDGSLGYGSPLPWILSIVDGLITLEVKLRGTFRPDRVGTSIVVPQSA